MRTTSPFTFLVIAATTTTLLTTQTEASKSFVARLPNGANVPNVPAIGHSDDTGDSSATNSFGDAFASAGKSWTTELCQADTDGDGQTNGQELGDPCCEWTQGATPRWTSGVSHPGDASKTSNESLWASVNCSGVTTVSTSGAGSLQTPTSLRYVLALGVTIALSLHTSPQASASSASDKTTNPSPHSPGNADTHTMKFTSPSILIVLAAAALFAPEADAKEEFVKLLPNGGNVPSAPAIGHKDNTGKSSSNNDFGKAFSSAGNAWTVELCKADTDGDGQTNGQELGDPCCEWTVGASPRWTSGVSHPSDATKTSNASLWASIDCSNIISACTLVAATAAALLASQAEASKEFVAMLPNGANVPGVPAIGHSDNTGDSDATNTFGDAFASAGKEWTTELCQADTDGDGQTNGEELGDPCCEWVMSTNDVVLWSTGVSHPGDASKTSDESLWANVTCGSSSTSDTASGSSSAATAGSL
ncbi:hypothetical protein BBJ28_00003157, partial [Nothophytophthora sp. Chile5]